MKTTLSRQIAVLERYHQIGGNALIKEGARKGEIELMKEDRKSTRLNSSHLGISYAVFCLKKKKEKREKERGGRPQPSLRLRQRRTATAAPIAARTARVSNPGTVVVTRVNFVVSFGSGVTITDPPAPVNGT